ncbi:hypothetical protein RhiirC2_866261 [Rhizophagus irregularis]|uniref:Uncharacterized protein n=1 Tax=Rhizophagus irregularis TaxID=588596 RepID=A0A2N1N8N8_9GLOM|nr:hypothetical protein RhiirC2_866261 [Rhizophagus irregularis]
MATAPPTFSEPAEAVYDFTNLYDISHSSLIFAQFPISGVDIGQWYPILPQSSSPLSHDERILQKQRRNYRKNKKKRERYRVNTFLKQEAEYQRRVQQEKYDRGYARAVAANLKRQTVFTRGTVKVKDQYGSVGWIYVFQCSFSPSVKTRYCDYATEAGSFRKETFPETVIEFGAEDLN